MTLSAQVAATQADPSGIFPRMRETQHYAEQAKLFARLAAEARSEAEREGFSSVAAGYLSLAKRAATRELSRPTPWETSGA